MTNKTIEIFNDKISPYQSTKSRHDIFVYQRFTGLSRRICNDCQKQWDEEYKKLAREQKAEEAEKEKKHQEESEKRGIINCLYNHFKNTPKKLKVVCD
ncbi:MAG: hypothetical protein NY202_02050 [Mollicutes bacterium UO1]